MTIPTIILNNACRRFAATNVVVSPRYVHYSTMISSRQRVGGCYRTFAALVRSPCVMEKISIKVPTMGDSITEGTIVEWTAGIGQAVKEGDVIALVETDKVTVDIKAEVEGVIVAHFGAIDDTIEVGADLYQIDTEATPEQISSSPIITKATEEGAAVVTQQTETTQTTMITTPTRTPSMTFLGKDGWAARLAGAMESTLVPSEPVAEGGIQTIYVPHMSSSYGRVPISEEEMEALITGGANLISD
mmetsp:Transcript_63850/g.75598  ORF Transcript_63850/g.75598 Transcript_63850/m.75598 type:complete len:246 (+) Transcript_63850:120-857(+)|eukprot:CAMPEP_0172483046 /NCGR_PEP_ID=MMETSP1066-20121228/9844_1 /TAXON_ID=671091 /ORGANISM="Coscinodiscus wailesii, Strain CCMP2513" /LENGTH=245 /DNA_ID=CAMNT_0013246687 /DNA_START=71 /DNA_END=808 /DNA_ORIENTATION=+